jgi:hypothetical protein
MGNIEPRKFAGHDISCPYGNIGKSDEVNGAIEPREFAGHGPPRRMPLRKQRQVGFHFEDGFHKVS